MSGLVDLLSSDQIEAINNFFDEARGRHPAWSAVNAKNREIKYCRKPKDFLVNQAVDAISWEGDNLAWRADIVRRVSRMADFEDVVGALAEIRCCGAMLEAGFQIRPIPTTKVPTPDFEFSLNGNDGVIEVTAKLEHGNEVARARHIVNGETPAGVERSAVSRPGGRIDFTISEMHPFGAPDPNKPGDTVQTNAISKICSIKCKETQIMDGRSRVLWIDFRDFGRWPGALTVDQSAPLICGPNGTLCSGAIWYAFYGWKGAPVFEDHMSGRRFVTPMAHFGRFAKEQSTPSQYSAAILCLESDTIFFENPMAEMPLADAHRAALTRLPHFNLQFSIANWKENDVECARTLAKNKIKALEHDRLRDE